VRDLEVVSEDSSLRVSLQYVVRRTGEIQTGTFERSNI
jgi:hypothetical protein